MATETIEQILYAPGYQDSGDLEAATKSITATSEPGAADYSAVLTLPAPSDARLVVTRLGVRLSVTIDSFAGGGATLNYRLKRAGVSLGTGTLSTGGSTGNKIVCMDATAGTLTGAATYELYLWVNAGSCVVSVCEIWSTVGIGSQPNWGLDCLRIDYVGMLTISAHVDRIGTGGAINFGFATLANNAADHRHTEVMHMPAAVAGGTNLAWMPSFVGTMFSPGTVFAQFDAKNAADLAYLANIGVILRTPADVPTASEIAAAILATPANLLETDADGAVTVGSYSAGQAPDNVGIALAAVSAGTAATQATAANLAASAVQTILTGITSLAAWLRALLRKSTADATALAEINSGGGTYVPATDSQEGLRDTLAAAVWANSERTLTMSGAAVAAVVAGTALTLQRGDDLMIALTGLGSLAGRTKLWFGLKTARAHADAQSIILVEETAGLQYFDGAAATAGDGSLVVDDAVAGDVTIRVAAARMAELTRFEAEWDLQMKTATVVSTLTQGTARLALDIVRATS